MEYFDIYNSERIPQNRTSMRGIPLKSGEYRLAVHICIFYRDKMLIQQRTNDKDTDASKWDLTAAGCVLAEETSAKAAERELYEELGISLDLSGKRPHLTMNFYEGFNDVFLVEKEIDPSTLRLQAEEVQAVKWASREEIIEMIEAGEFISYYPAFISLLFEIRQNFGANTYKPKEKNT